MHVFGFSIEPSSFFPKQISYDNSDKMIIFLRNNNSVPSKTKYFLMLLTSRKTYHHLVENSR